MKKLSFLFIIILISVFGSCNFSKGVKKDFSTGLTTSYNGYTLDDIYLSDAKGTRLNNNKISMGTVVFITATGVGYFQEKDGKVFPGCTILLTDKTGKEILNLPDAFSDLSNGTTAAEAKTLQASLSTGNPMLVGETYHLNVRFYDKNKKENRIVADVDLIME